MTNPMNQALHFITIMYVVQLDHKSIIFFPKVCTMLSTIQFVLVLFFPFFVLFHRSNCSHSISYFQTIIIAGLSSGPTGWIFWHLLCFHKVHSTCFLLEFPRPPYLLGWQTPSSAGAGGMKRACPETIGDLANGLKIKSFYVCKSVWPTDVTHI